VCMKRGLNHGVPKWYRLGYRLKDYCDKCGFRSTCNEVFRVYHVDGNLDNCRRSNLKTVCANCRIELAYVETTWRQGDLVADF